MRSAVDGLGESARRLAVVLVSLAAALVALELVRPLQAGPVGFDSAASVIYFDRIAAGRHLEAFITATPKPLLTAIYGPLQAATGDWRPISWATIAAYAVGAGLAAWLLGRVGGITAGAFAAGAILASRPLLADTAIAYAVPWAFVGWLAAGLLLTARRPRPGLAGLVLGLAALARLETLVIVVAAAVALTIGALAARAGVVVRPPDRRWWLVPVIGAMAVPVMLLHDWMLTGDPLFWLSVSARYSAAAPESVMTPVELGRLLVSRYAGMGLLGLAAVLAAVGVVALAARRQWVPFTGLIGLGPGIAAFLLVLAARGTYVSPRYLAAIDVALALAAAAGAATLLGLASDRWPGGRSQRPLLRVGLPIAAALGLAALSSWPIPSLDASFRSASRAPRLQAERTARVVPVMACALDAMPGSREFPPESASGPTSTDPAATVVMVAGLQRPNLSVDLDVPLDKISGIPPSWLEPGAGFLPYGRLIYHDARSDRPPEDFAVLEVGAPTTIDEVTLVPLLADAEAGIWVLRVDRPTGPAGGPPCNVAPDP